MDLVIPWYMAIAFFLAGCFACIRLSNMLIERSEIMVLRKGGEY